MRAYKFRIYPSKKQEKEMELHLFLSKQLWNELLAFSKEHYLSFHLLPTKTALREIAKECGLYSQVAQALVDRLHKALWQKAKEKKGFPRFKSFEKMKTLIYPQFGFSLENKLKTQFGEISIKQHRAVAGRIKTLTLKRESSGKWFAIFCAEEEKKAPAENRGEKIGIDLGLKSFATLSNGKVIANPRHFMRFEAKLRSCQQNLSRCARGSKNRRKAKLKVARIHERISNCRADFLHKLSREIVTTYSFIALESLSSKEMAENRFGKSINDAGWGMFANMLAYKAEEAGCEVMFVNPKDTTTECSSCGALVYKKLEERMHNCSFCGLNTDRDLNAALNILMRATVGTTGSNSSGDERVLSSVKEDAT
ncbi:MAG: transposase [Candidatus Micrarchaeota archaeon]